MSCSFFGLALGIIAALCYAYGAYQKRVADSLKDQLEEMRINSLLEEAKKRNKK